MEMKKSKKINLDRFDRDTKNCIQVFLILVVLVIIATILSKGTFIKTKNLLNILNQNMILMITALAQFLIIVLSGIDLSVGSVIALSSVIIVKFSHLGLWGSIAFAFIAAVLVGLLNASLVNIFKLPTFIVTLATMEIVYSFSKMLTGGAAVYTSESGVTPDERLLGFFKGKTLGIPNPILVCIVVIIFLALFLKTKFGVNLFATGGNEAAANLSGVNTAKVKIIAHIAASFICSIAGVLFVSRVGMGDPQTGSTQQIDSIAAVTIGGTSMAGGSGTLVGAVLGVLILSVLSNIMSLMHIPSTIQPAIKGVAILIAVYFNTRENSN